MRIHHDLLCWFSLSVMMRTVPNSIKTDVLAKFEVMGWKQGYDLTVVVPKPSHDGPGEGGNLLG